MESNQKQGFTNFFKRLYTEEIYIIAKQAKRGRISSCLQLAIKYLLIILLGDIIEYQQDLTKIDYNFQFLDEHSFYHFLSDSQYQNQIVLIIFYINLTIFSLLNLVLFDLLLRYLFQGNSSTFLLYKITYSSNSQNHIFEQLKKVLSSLIQCYGYTLLLPTVYYSFKDLYSVYSIINLLIALLLGNSLNRNILKKYFDEIQIK
ncbi:hypothetical protein ABPG74_002488 [Tetrahymena malaccensis]